MQIMLAKAYDRHVKAVRSRQQADHGRAVIDRSEVKKSVIPVLSGLTGIGKTADVKSIAPPMLVMSEVLTVAIQASRHDPQILLPEDIWPELEAADE